MSGMNKNLKRVLSAAIFITMIFQQVGFTQGLTELNISGYLQGMKPGPREIKFQMPCLRYVDYSNPKSLKVFLDKGGSDQSKGIEAQAKSPLDYFFVGITLPNESFWVNLRPDSPDNIIDSYLSNTDMGKVLLEADVQLKKDTARMTSPATAEGKAYWDKLYKKAEELLGYENVTIPTLVRPWIVPGEIIVRENGSNAYIYKASLKVMLEEDHLRRDSPLRGQSLSPALYSFKDPRLKALNEYSARLIRQAILPILTRQVNTSAKYASLRQVYYSLILAQWFKVKFRGQQGLYARMINRKDLTNLMSSDNWSKTTYFNQYQASFKNGEYNIQEPIRTPFGQSVRRYFSGGVDFAGISSPVQNGVLTGTLSALAIIKNASSPVQEATVSGMPLSLVVSANDSRGFDGLPNDEYSQDIRDALAAHNFGAYVFRRTGVTQAELYFDNVIVSRSGEVSSRLTYVSRADQKVQFGHAQLERLYLAIRALGIQEGLEGTHLIFIPLQKPHYSVGRNQIFLDANLLNSHIDTYEQLKTALYHEFKERADIIAGLKRHPRLWEELVTKMGYSDTTEAKMRSLELRTEIIRLAGEAHQRLKLSPLPASASSSPVQQKLYSFNVEGIPDFEAIEKDEYHFQEMPRGTFEVNPAFVETMAKPQVRSIPREYDLRGDTAVFDDDATRALISAQTVMAYQMGEGNNRNVLVTADQEDYNQAGVEIAIEQFKRAGFKVFHINRPCTSPLAYVAALYLNCDNIAFFSASHNPYGDKGLKLGIKKGTTFGPFGTRRIFEISQQGLMVRNAEKEGEVINLSFSSPDLQKALDYYQQIHSEYLGITLDPAYFYLLFNPIGGTSGFDTSGNSSLVAILERMRFGYDTYEFMDGKMHSSREIPGQKQPNPELAWVKDEMQPRLQEAAQMHPDKVTVGMAFDRDSDRQTLLDDRAQSSADKLGVLAIRQLAKNYRKKNPGDKRKIVVYVDMKCSLLVFNDPVLKSLNVEARPTKTGHSYLKWHLRSAGKNASEVTLAAFEQSGHCFYRINPADPQSQVVEDPLAFIFAVLQYLQENKLTLAGALNDFDNYEVGPSTKFYLDSSKFDSGKTGQVTLKERKYAFMEETWSYLQHLAGQLVAGNKYRLHGVEQISGTNFRLFFSDPQQTMLIGSCTFRPSSNEEVLTINIDADRNIEGVDAVQFIRDIQNFVVFNLCAARAPEFTTLYPTQENKKLGILGSANMLAEEMLDYALANGWEKAGGLNQEGEQIIRHRQSRNEVTIVLSTASSPAAASFPVTSAKERAASSSSPVVEYATMSIDTMEADIEKLSRIPGVNMGEGDIRQVFIASIDTNMLLNDFAESVGIKRDEALNNIVATGLARRNSSPDGYGLVNGFFSEKNLEIFRKKQVASSANPPAVDLSPLRIQRIILNAVNTDGFISRLASSISMQRERLADAMKEHNILPTLVAAWQLEEALKNHSAENTNLWTENFVSPKSAEHYSSQGVDAKFSFPHQAKLNPEVLSALQEYQRVMAADMARGGYNYRGAGAGTATSVREFYEKEFLPKWDSLIRSFVTVNFPNGRPSAIVTTGIGANDQFMWALVRMYNQNRPQGAPKWYHIATARDLAALKKEVTDLKNVLYIDISRSGGTWETAEVALRSLSMGSLKHIALANGGAVKAIALKAAEMGGHQPLVIGMSPDIGGRNMHRKTTIYYTAQTVAGMFLSAMDSGNFARLHDEFDRANDFASPETSLPLSAGQFLHAGMILGAEHIAVVTNTEPLRLTATEWEQYIMEGSNKAHIISMGIHDLARENEDHVLSVFTNSPAAGRSMAMVLLDKAAPTYPRDLRLTEALAAKMPLMIFTIDTSKEKLKGGMGLVQQAAFDILWTDLVTVFTTLLRVDANSNPNVRQVRELTAQRVAGWRDAETAYAADPLGQGRAKILVSYGNPKGRKIGSQGQQISLTRENAKKQGEAMAQNLLRDDMFFGRNRLNLFVGRDDLMPVVGALREYTYLDTAMVRSFGFIPQTALFPLWSHKGLEANLARDEHKRLLADATINIFLNARRLDLSEELYSQTFDNLGVEDAKYKGIKGATIHQTNDAMTFPNIIRLAEVSPTILFEFNDFDAETRYIIEDFYKAFIAGLQENLVSSSSPVDLQGLMAQLDANEAKDRAAAARELKTQVVSSSLSGEQIWIIAGKLREVKAFETDTDVSRDMEALSKSIDLALAKVSSPATNNKSLGGIDFRVMNMNIQQAGQFLLKNIPQRIMPPIERAQAWSDIQRMVKAGISPSGERLWGYIYSCSQAGLTDAKREQLLACIADILKTDEKFGLKTDPAVKGALVLLEENKLPSGTHPGITEDLAYSDDED